MVFPLNEIATVCWSWISVLELGIWIKFVSPKALCYQGKHFILLGQPSILNKEAVLAKRSSK